MSWIRAALSEVPDQQIASQLVQAQAYAHQAELENMPTSAAYWHAEIGRLMAQLQRRSSEGPW